MCDCLQRRPGAIDEKSQIQSLPLARTGALDRTQPGLPLKPGKCGTMTHDYKRTGITTLFAALIARVLTAHWDHPNSISRGNTSFENRVRLPTVSSWLIVPPWPIINRWPKPPTWS